jgi:hypothetical protein
MDSSQIAIMASCVLGSLAFIVFVVLAITARIASPSPDEAPFVVHVGRMH